MTKEYFVSNKVYHIKICDYYDKYTVGIFTTKEKAKEYIKKICDSSIMFHKCDFNITEVELDKGSI